MCVLISFAWVRPSLIMDLQPVQSWVLHTVDSLNVKHELMIVETKAILYHADISKRYFSVCHLKIVFYFLHELKQGVF